MRELWTKLERVFGRRRGLEEDLAGEIESHIDLAIADHIARGMPPDEARAAARRGFGNPASVRENARESWQFPRFETILQDLRYGLRGFRRTPGFAAAIVLTLALGVGANTAIFSVVYNVLLRPLPYPSSERLVRLGESTGKAKDISVTWINFQHWRNENATFENMAAYTGGNLTLTGRGEALLTHAAFVTSSFFPLTAAQTQMGRLFTARDDRISAPPVVVLSGEFWMDRLGADPAVLGSALALNGKPYQVIGVLRPGLKFFNSIDYYLPLAPSAGRNTSRGAHGSIRVLGLMKPGVKLANARANLNAIMRRLDLSDPGTEAGHVPYGEYLMENVTGGIRQTLLILMSAVALILVIACANVASLLLVRGSARTREFAIRTAIGAGRGRIARQLLSENVVLAGLGGALGLILAEVALGALVRLAPAGLPRIAEIGLDFHVMLFAAALTLITALVAGIAPALACDRVNPSSALKEGAPGSGSGKRSNAARGALVIAEIAITLVLSFGAGLLIRSLIEVRNKYPGFDPHNVLALELQLPSSSYKTAAQSRQFYAHLIDLVRNVPGVRDVGAVNCAPTAGNCGDWWYSVIGKPVPDRDNVPLTLIDIADNDYFRAMRIHLLAGRAFSDTDREGGAPVTIVNEDVARKWWPAPQSAIGERIKIGGPYMEGAVREIVGVAANVSQMGLDGEPMPQIYFPFTQGNSNSMVVLVRTSQDPAALIPAVRRAVAALDRNLPIQTLRPFESWMGASLERRRFSTLLLGIFAALAGLLALVGIYGVLNYWVAIRNREIAVRMALGAQRSGIVVWAGGHALRLAALGTVVGACAAWGATRWMASLVYGAPARDPAILLGAGAAVFAIAAMAASLPVWRASRVDVARNLHEG